MLALNRLALHPISEMWDLDNNLNPNLNEDENLNF